MTFLRRWIAVTTLAEIVGFAIPASVGVVTVDAPAPVAYGALIAAGVGEGALLGATQALVLRRALPALSARAWVAADGRRAHGHRPHPDAQR